MVHDVTIRFSSARDPGEIKGGVNELECQPAGGSKDVVCRACSPPMATGRVPRRKAILILAAAGIAVSAIANFVQNPSVGLWHELQKSHCRNRTQDFRDTLLE